MDETSSSEHDVFIELSNPQKLNEPWLEARSIAVEEALIERMSDRLLGHSVTANFDINGFEIDLTIPAVDATKQREVVAEVVAIVEEVAEIQIGGSSNQETQIRSGFRGEAHRKCDEHDLTPA